MALPNEPWSTNLPTSQDTVGVEQPDLTPDSTPGAEDGHRLLVSHLHSLRDKAQYNSETIGDASNLPAGCLKAKVAALESAPPSHASSHEPGGGDAMAVDAAAGTGSLRTLGTGSTNACAGDDSRLSDSRTPTSHASSHQNGGGDEIATATPAANAIPKAGAGGDLDGGWMPYGSSASTVCEGNDSRLSDARTPTSHASAHEPGGGDAMTVDAAAGTGSLRTLGTGSTNACAGDDSRLSDARTPVSHATSHENGGGDEISVAGLSGLLADDQNPVAHATDHQHGGGDEIATATPGANAIPKADAAGKLAEGWIQDIQPAVGSTVKLYIDGTAGSDVTGDGAAWGTAYATFDHVWNNVLPAVLRDKYIIQFRNAGAVADTNPNGGVHAGKVLLGADAKFVVVGEDGYSSSAGGTFTGGDTKTGVLGAAGWTVNEHAGKWVRITTGPDAGYVRSVIRNTADTLYLNVDLANTASGQTWEWVEPSATAVGRFATVWTAGTQAGGGVTYDHFKHSGDLLEVLGAPGAVSYGNLYNVGQSRVRLPKGGGNTFSATAVKTSSTTGDDLSDGVDRGGVCHDLSGTENGLLDLQGVNAMDVQGWVAAGLEMADCELWGDFGGNGDTDTIRASIINPSNANRCAMMRMCKVQDAAKGIGFYIDAESGGQDGLRALGSNLILVAGMVANNCVDGLSLIESTVAMSRGMTGTGNSGWGLRARRGSFVTIDRTTSDPSVTGTSGDVELDSGSSTWATILGGTALVDPVEMASVYVDTALIQEAGW